MENRELSALAEAIAGRIFVELEASGRHVHVTAQQALVLFGHPLTPKRPLSQPGQYACKELLTIVGPSLRPIENVRVLGPLRKQSQVEISRTDSFVLKVKPPVRESGKLDGSAGITIIGPKGVVSLAEGCIIANRHIHMSVEEGAAFGLKDGDYVTVEADGERHPFLRRAGAGE